MEDLFNGALPDGERADIQLYIFPHIQEFLAIDLRESVPQVSLLDSGEIFDGEFYRTVEDDFSHTLREKTAFPFDHLMHLPLQVEEIVRGVAMTAILDRMGLVPEEEEEMPAVVVFIISGASLSMHLDQLIESFRKLLGPPTEGLTIKRWEGVFNRLVKEEHAAVKKLSHLDLTEAIKGDSPDYFTLWESRN